jgi:hypothetical protein
MQKPSRNVAIAANVASVAFAINADDVFALKKALADAAEQDGREQFKPGGPLNWQRLALMALKVRATRCLYWFVASPALPLFDSTLAASDKAAAEADPRPFAEDLLTHCVANSDIKSMATLCSAMASCLPEDRKARWREIATAFARDLLLANLDAGAARLLPLIDSMSEALGAQGGAQILGILPKESRVLCPRLLSAVEAEEISAVAAKAKAEKRAAPDSLQKGAEPQKAPRL